MLKEKEEIASTASTTKTKIYAIIFLFIGVVTLSILGIHMILGSESVYFSNDDDFNVTLYGGFMSLIFSIVSLWRPAFLILASVGVGMIGISFIYSEYYGEILRDDICEEWKEDGLFTDTESEFGPCSDR